LWQIIFNKGIIMLDKAIRLAAEKFEGKFDKGGKPYILHCLHVMNAIGPDEYLMTAGVLHDIVEDTDVTLDDIYKIFGSQTLVWILDCLTHKDGEDYDSYIERVSTNPSAVKIKLADLRHNSDIMRLKGLTKKDFNRLAKYAKAYTYLSNI